MKSLKNPLALLVGLSLISVTAFWTRVATATVSQTQSTALERGYRTGYSDGYAAGSKDIANHADRNYQKADDYQHADRAYNEAWGTIEDYRDGYQQGFETGYSAGYDQRPFESSIPKGLSRRGAVTNANDNSQVVNQPAPNDQTVNTSAPPAAPLSIPRDAVLTVSLESSLSTDASQRGDRFRARVIEPREFAGAVVEGRVARVKRPGRVKGTAELQLEFDSIQMPDGRVTPISADVVELLDSGRRDDAGSVDSEGGVRGRSTTKDDISKVGASAGIGAIIGAVIGGGKGAAIGAVIGGAAGTGSVVSKRGEDVRLPQGQQMRIRTATDVRLG